MSYEPLQEQHIMAGDTEALKEVEALLKNQGLTLEPSLDFTMAYYEKNQVVGTGSLSRNVLKCMAVEPRLQGQGLAARIITRLIQEAFERGYTHLFVFTGMNNKSIFTDMGFYEIGSVPPDVILMENQSHGLKNYLQKIQAAAPSGEGNAGSIVLNCNPFTLGHQYLIETAANVTDLLHLFVVWEDRSTFPAEDRYQMVLEGTAHLTNVQVHRGRDYIISSATFPTYFLKDASQATEIHCRLDLDLFGGKIAPALDIKRRFVGEEPYCEVTRLYNSIMKEVLPSYGVEVVEIPRLEGDHGWISASKVREALRGDDHSLVEKMVPASTMAYLKSSKGQEVIRKLRQNDGRH